MKSLLLVIFILTISCASQNVSKIKLSYVDLDILTIIDVGCDNFEQLFNSEIKTSVVSNDQDIKSIVALLNNLKVDTLKRMPDVRVKIEFNNNAKPTFYCLSKMGICSEGNSYILPDELLLIIKKYMK